MGAPKKLKKPVYVTTILEKSQHDALKYMSHQKSKSMSELFREALLKFISHESRSGKGTLLDLRGTGKGLWEEDAQEYVNKLRDEWDD